MQASSPDVRSLSHCATSSAGGRLSSEPKRRADRDHRRATGVDGFDDLGVVDALEIDRGHAEVSVAELALDHDQWHTFASHLDGADMS
jgi:hypothetical protein